MKRKVIKWLIGALIAGVVIIIVAFLSVDTVARLLAERRVQSETGMETHIGKFNIGFSTATLRIENFVLINPAEFGGGTFVEMPELFVEYDRDALRAGKLHLKEVRINISEIHVFENKEGKRNVDQLQKQSAKSKPGRSPSQKSELPFEFEGVDKLEVTLRLARFTNLREPAKNMETDLGIQNETFRNLKTENDFKTAAAVLAIKAGGSFLLGGNLLNPRSLLNKSSAAGVETKNVLESLTAPVLEKQGATNP